MIMSGKIHFERFCETVVEVGLPPIYGLPAYEEEPTYAEELAYADEPAYAEEPAYADEPNAYEFPNEFQPESFDSTTVASTTWSTTIQTTGQKGNKKVEPTTREPTTIEPEDKTTTTSWSTITSTENVNFEPNMIFEPTTNEPTTTSTLGSHHDWFPTTTEKTTEPSGFGTDFPFNQNNRESGFPPTLGGFNDIQFEEFEEIEEDGGVEDYNERQGSCFCTNFRYLSKKSKKSKILKKNPKNPCS